MDFATQVTTCGLLEYNLTAIQPVLPYRCDSRGRTDHRAYWKHLPNRLFSLCKTCNSIGSQKTVLGETARYVIVQQGVICDCMCICCILLLLCCFSLIRSLAEDNRNEWYGLRFDYWYFCLCTVSHKTLFFSITGIC